MKLYKAITKDSQFSFEMQAKSKEQVKNHIKKMGFLLTNWIIEKII